MPKARLRFDFSDVFRSARYSFSLRQLFTQVVAFVPGYVIYLFLAYSSLLFSGQSLSTVWARFGLFPCLFAAARAGGQTPAGSHSIPAWILFGLGVAGLATAFLLANAAGGRLMYMKLCGNYSYSIREAYDFALHKLGAMVMTPLAIGIIVVVLGCGGLLVGLIGRIPYIGELTVTGFAWLWMLASLVIFVLLLMAGISFILTPSIVATTEEDAFEAIFQTASIIWSQPWRLLLYLSGVVLTATVGLVVSAFSAKRAFAIMDALFTVAMGTGYQNLSAQAQYLLQSWTTEAGNWLLSVVPSVTPYFFFSRLHAPVELSPWFNVLAHIFAFSLLFSAVWVLAYPLSIINSGLTLTYLVLRKIKDDENLLERYQANESTSP
jgi:hypothetical protein